MKALFIDDHVVEEINNLARKLHPLQKFDKNVALRPEHRWENCGIMMWTTPAWIPDEAVFKTLYYASSESDSPEVKLDVTGAPIGGQSFICYATSEDGVNWEKPALDSTITMPLHGGELRLAKRIISYRQGYRWDQSTIPMLLRNSVATKAWDGEKVVG